MKTGDHELSSFPFRWHRSLKVPNKSPSPWLPVSQSGLIWEVRRAPWVGSEFCASGANQCTSWAPLFNTLKEKECCNNEDSLAFQTSFVVGFWTGMTKEVMINASRPCLRLLCLSVQPMFQKATMRTFICSLDIECLTLSVKKELTRDIIRKILEKRCRCFTVSVSNTSWCHRRAHNWTARAGISRPTWTGTCTF